MKRIVCGIILSIFFLASSVVAADTVIQNIRISNSSTHLNLRFHLANSFSPKMEEAINNGIPTAFTFYVNLYQIRSFWNDKFLAATTLTKTIKYDNLKNEYTIVTTQNNQETSSTSLELPTLIEAKKIMTLVEILSIYHLWKLERNNTYYFEVKAEAEGVKPPPYIHYLLFFLDGKYFETPWEIEKFRY